jgi:large subunit ribosomal protein L3
MPSLSRPRRGSLQFYPRKRAVKQIPSVNWKPISLKKDLPENSILGFITYKVGMASAIVKDNTEHSQTKGKKKVIPVTVLEAPNMKIFSARFYNKGVSVKDVLLSNDKELKKKLKVPKSISTLDKDLPKEYDDIRIIVYSIPKQTSIKKSPDLIEIALSGTKESKIELIKSFIGKEITITNFEKLKLLDARGLTKGKGFQGPVKRFGVTLRSHKAEKGQRKVGSIGPWHPARVTFRVPMAGQLGLFSRVHYNFNVISSGNIKEKNINPKQGFKHFGNIKFSYIILAGSVQGPTKHPVLLTSPLRANKKQSKKNYELLEVVTK